MSLLCHGLAPSCSIQKSERIEMNWKNITNCYYIAYVLPFTICCVQQGINTDTLPVLVYLNKYIQITNVTDNFYYCFDYNRLVIIFLAKLSSGRKSIKVNRQLNSFSTTSLHSILTTKIGFVVLFGSLSLIDIRTSYTNFPLFFILNSRYK